ncbi:hypothetical protein [Nonomuraea sp. NPDC049504]|uniref:hypothetical protein n=1 Tax=Nonomuraea sp. NPDC049504 TaxID=3154729 RepID=UPI0034223441
MGETLQVREKFRRPGGAEARAGVVAAVEAEPFRLRPTALRAVRTAQPTLAPTSPRGKGTV